MHLAAGALALLPVLASASVSRIDERARLDAGELLLGEAACTACHAAGAATLERLRPRRAPDLARIGARARPSWLRAFLAAPHAELPGTPMPDLLAGLEPEERARTLDELVQFLVSLGGPLVAPPAAASLAELERGRQLYHEVGCVACHEPLEAAWALVWTVEELSAQERAGARAELRGGSTAAPVHAWRSSPPPLAQLARKTGAGALAAFLEAPLALRPSGRMPDLGLTPGEARAIALYLSAELGGSEPELVQGLAYEAFEGVFDGGAIAWDALEPLRRGSVQEIALPEHREENFAFRFRGRIEVERAGRYSFWTRSDDGSTLSIGGNLVVDNGGIHAMQERGGELELEEGFHAFELTFFEHTDGQGLEVDWAGPDFGKQALPGRVLSHVAARLAPIDEGFTVDPEGARAGAQAFLRLGCSSCHVLEAGLAADAAPRRAAPPLAELDPDGSGAANGCLAPEPRAGLPRYAFDEGQRAAIAATLRRRDDLERAPSTAELVAASLARLNCLACHERDGLGGPEPARMAYFRTRGEAELGDEGRLPPPLTRAGAKLRPAWLRAVLEEGAAARPYMAARMPRFGAANVAGLARALESLDAPPEEEREPDFRLASIEEGRLLAGTRGLGCIQCHTFAGHASLGVPATDLAELHARLRFGWFRELLLDPMAVNMNTRMPLFWEGGRSPVREVAAGDPQRQIEALWTYLALGRAMPLPEGLVVREGEYELVPRERPIVAGVFMRGVGPRTLVVGHPERVHYAFDVEGSRLAKLWRGRFFDMRGTWHARAGALEEPPVPRAEVIDLPPGPPLARLAGAGADWPLGPARELGYRVLGRRWDAERRPAFRYALRDVEVLEQLVPVHGPEGPGFLRRLALVAPAPAADLWLRLAAGVPIEDLGEGVWRGGPLVLTLPAGARTEATAAGGAGELRVAIDGWHAAADGRFEASLEVGMRW